MIAERSPSLVTAAMADHFRYLDRPSASDRNRQALWCLQSDAASSDFQLQSPRGNRCLSGIRFSWHRNRVIKGTEQGYVKILLYDAQSMSLLHFLIRLIPIKKNVYLHNYQ